MATYRTLYNQALSSIKSICMNVSNFGALPSHYKPGYTYTQSNARAYLKWSISNPVNQVSTDTVDTDFSNLMNTYGITGILDNTVTPRGILNFYTALAVFCTARVCICSSQLNTNKYIVYDNSTSYSTYTKIPEGDLIYATDINTICGNINSIIGSNIKSKFIKYTTSIYGG